MTKSPQDKCIWCHGPDGQLQTITVSSTDRLGRNPHEEEVVVHPHHAPETRSFCQFAARYGKTFVVAMASGTVVAVALAVLITTTLAETPRGEGCSGSFVLQIRGDWVVELEPDANVKQVRKILEPLLTDCESFGVEGFRPINWQLKCSAPSLYTRFKAISIGSVHRIRSDGEGRVYLSMSGVGGCVDTKGRAVPTWISEFLRAPEREDVLAKLQNSGAAECHVFVPVSFGGVPWNVESYLSDRSRILPHASPDLPAPVTAAWILYGRKGLLWDGAAWHLFAGYQAQRP